MSILRELIGKWKRRNNVQCHRCSSKDTIDLGVFSFNRIENWKTIRRYHCVPCKRYFYIRYNRATEMFGCYLGESDLP